ncbi:hypothetical protein RJT34_23751 [Clitoria ternatea]|uniref:Uncharacterized protein n=1 Tax=Clitoria ternatea TaxID=43366 RepID=A0AAN9FSW0_CLITE
MVLGLGDWSLSAIGFRAQACSITQAWSPLYAQAWSPLYAQAWGGKLKRQRFGIWWSSIAQAWNDKLKRERVVILSPLYAQAWKKSLKHERVGYLVTFVRSSVGRDAYAPPVLEFGGLHWLRRADTRLSAMGYRILSALHAKSGDRHLSPIQVSLRSLKRGYFRLSAIGVTCLAFMAWVKISLKREANWDLMLSWVKTSNLRLSATGVGFFQSLVVEAWGQELRRHRVSLPLFLFSSPENSFPSSVLSAENSVAVVDAIYGCFSLG